MAEFLSYRPKMGLWFGVGGIAIDAVCFRTLRAGAAGAHRPLMALRNYDVLIVEGPRLHSFIPATPE